MNETEREEWAEIVIEREGAFWPTATYKDFQGTWDSVSHLIEIADIDNTATVTWNVVRTETHQYEGDGVEDGQDYESSSTERSEDVVRVQFNQGLPPRLHSSLPPGWLGECADALRSR